ncbi:hypothetical protein SK128_009915 [Halocaridina rubra]|uniref:Methyltransferase type 11 domain-containing protein n=1 Tax=Halocaridina rubra TaxID=373956 RepID=A0AAN9A4U8_HALRR
MRMPFSSVIAYSAISLAIFNSGLAALAFYKWLKTKEKLRKYTEKYNNSKEVQRYLMHHFGQVKDLPHLAAIIPLELANYHSLLALFTSDTCDEYDVPKVRVLDVGCGPGGTSFQLSRFFREVIGTDTSMDMLMAGQMLKQFNEFTASFSNEGGKHISMIKVRVPEGADRERVTFLDEDVCALSYKCGFFDCVLVSNALTDLSDPKQFLESIGEYVKTGGLLIISDVFNWENGPEEDLNGEGDNLSVSEIRKILSSAWIFKKEHDIPYYFPRCARLAEVGNSNITVWMRAPENCDD